MSTGIGGITIKHIKNVLVSAAKGHQKLPLGRWGTCQSKNTNLVVDYSNEDHCGPCGMYVKIVNEKNTQQKLDEELLTIEYEHMLTNTPSIKNKQRNSYKPLLKYEDAVKLMKTTRPNFRT
jgi:hypothetical protein